MQLVQNLDILTLTLIISIGLCIAGVIFFLALKRYEYAIVMLILSSWIHFLFAVNIPKSPEEMLEVGLSSYVRIFFVLFVGSIGLIKFFNEKSSIEEKLPFYISLFGVFLLYALFSTSYSIDRKYTFVRSVEFIAFFCFLLGFYYWLTDESKVNKVIDIFFLIILFGFLINITTFVLFPDLAWWWESPNRFQGFMFHPNTLGGFCMISYPVLMWKYNQQESTGKIYIALMLCLLALMHILSGSRSTIAASIIGYGIWQIIINKKIKLIMTAVAILFFGYLLLEAQLPSFERYQSKSITHLSGRTDFWRGSFQIAKERPILGYGYAVDGKIWDNPHFYSKNSYLWMGSARSSIHNGYLSLAIGLGFTGLAIWLSFLIPVLLQLLYLPASYYKALLMVMLTQFLVINFFESVISSNSFVSISFWIFWIIAIKYFHFTTQESD